MTDTPRHKAARPKPEAVRQRASRRRQAEAAFDALVHQPHTIDQLKLAGLVAATGIFLFLTYRLLEPFVMPLASAVALTVLMNPVHQYLLPRLRRPALAALASVVLAVLVVALPIALVVQRLVADIARITAGVTAMASTGNWRDLVVGQPWLADLLHLAERRLDLARITRELSDWVGGWVPAVLQGSSQQLAGLVIALYFMFFMLRDRTSALLAVSALSPLPAAKMAELYHQLAETIRATVFGTLVIALIQGTLAGTAFWVAGVPSPVLWGSLTAIAATVPMLGTVVVWGPAVAWLFLDHRFAAAAGLLVWSLTVVSTIDNVLFPYLVGGRLQMHTVPTFIALVGGVICFGPAGLILGPVILSTTAFLIGFWRQEPAA